MTLILRIENFDQLENGGPTWLQLDGNGASVGRRASMDWTLPDPSKMISGHHFDITYQNGTYLLTDVSMNGTFLDGQRHRLEGPMTLRGGERFIVGHYIIGVDLPAAGADAGAASAPVDEGDPWGDYADPAGIQPVAGGRGAGIDDLGGGFIQMPGAGRQNAVHPESSLQMPLHSQPPMQAPQAPQSVPPSRGQLQTPGSWGGAQAPSAPYTPDLGQPAADDSPFGDQQPLPSAPPPEPEPAAQSTPPYVPTLGQEEPEPEPVPAPEPEPQAEPEPAPQPQAEPEAQAGPEAQAPSAPPPSSEPQPALEPAPEREPASEIHALPDPNLEHEESETPFPSDPSAEPSPAPESEPEDAPEATEAPDPDAPEVYTPSFTLPDLEDVPQPQAKRGGFVSHPAQPPQPDQQPDHAPEPSQAQTPGQDAFPAPPGADPYPPQPGPGAMPPQPGPGGLPPQPGADAFPPAPGAGGFPPPQQPGAIPRPRPMPPGAPPSPVPTPGLGPAMGGMAPRAPQQPMAPAGQPAPQPAGGHGSHGEVSAAMRAFCEGAGLDPNSVKPEDAIHLMHMLGRCVRIATEEIMHMLKARADVKNFTRGGVRTMLSANANNPMKFMPDSQQALELMFVAPRDGFMTGPDSFDDALKDIRIHQEAVFRALQPALAEVFRGLSPEEIEAACENTGSNLLGGIRAGRQWPTYVERWDEKAQAGENGILDAFLQAFARSYAEANKRKP